MRRDEEYASDEQDGYDEEVSEEQQQEEEIHVCVPYDKAVVAVLREIHAITSPDPLVHDVEGGPSSARKSATALVAAADAAEYTALADTSTAHIVENGSFPAQGIKNENVSRGDSSNKLASAKARKREASANLKQAIRTAEYTSPNTSAANTESGGIGGTSPRQGSNKEEDSGDDDNNRLKSAKAQMRAASANLKQAVRTAEYTSGATSVANSCSNGSGASPVLRNEEEDSGENSNKRLTSALARKRAASANLKQAIERSQEHTINAPAENYGGKIHNGKNLQHTDAAAEEDVEARLAALEAKFFQFENSIDSKIWGMQSDLEERLMEKMKLELQRGTQMLRTQRGRASMLHRSTTGGTHEPLPNGGNPKEKSSLEDKKRLEKNLTQDTFSLMIVSPVMSRPFFLAILVTCLQLAIYTFAAFDLIDMSNEGNPINIPSNVSNTVRLTQFLLLLVAVILNKDLIVVFDIVRDGFSPVFYDTFEHATLFKFALSCATRFIQGSFSLLVLFFLVLSGESVVEMLLNFAALEVSTGPVKRN